MRSLLVAAVSAFVVLPATSRAQTELSPEEEATVRIYTINSVSLIEQPLQDGSSVFLAVPETAHGSGVVLTADGLILTAKHVVSGVTAMSVKLPEQSRAMPAVLVYEHPTLDLAFIKVRGNFQYYVPLPEASAVRQLRTRDHVFSIGYPLDPSQSTPTTTEGSVSRMSDDGMLQLGTSLNPGNSGGPVFAENASGQPELVGIVVAKPVEGEGIAWIQPIAPVIQAYERDVVPGAYVERALEQLSGDPVRMRALEDLSVLVAEMTEAFYDDSNPHWIDNPDDAQTFARIADSGVPQAALLCAAYFFNQFSLNGDFSGLDLAGQIVEDIKLNEPGVFYASQFAQELDAFLTQLFYCDASSPCADPGSECSNNQCTSLTCRSDADCPPASICNSDGLCGGVACDDTTACPSGFACSDGFCQVSTPPPPPVPTGGCGSCAVGGLGTSDARSASVLIGLLAVVLWRRRRAAR